jgi:hypothetical protein
MALVLDSADFDRWAGPGLAVAQTTWRGGECAAWYFRLSPQFLAHLDLDALIQLVESSRQATQVAPQLGIELLRAAAHLVESHHQVNLRDWVAVGERLAPVGQSGRLAQAYFEGSPEMLVLTGVRAFQEWTGLVQALATTTEVVALEVVRQSPRHLEHIPPQARPTALRLVHAMARLAPTTCLEVLRALPEALHVVAAALRDRLFDMALRVAEASPRHLDHLLKAITRLLPALPEAAQEIVLAQCLRVSTVDAEAGTLLCDHLPGMLGQLVAEDIEVWVTEGLQILREHRDGGLAYFARESQASQTALAVLGRSAYLSPVQGVLRLYASALAGRSLSVRPLAELPQLFRSGLRQFPTMDGDTVYLPETVDRFGCREHNFQLLRVMTAHQTGYLEFATFSFELDVLLRRLGTTEAAPHLPAWRALDAPPASLPTDFERFFAGFARAAVARDIFYCLEDGRVDYLLCRTYRGLAPQMERIIRDGLCSRPPLTGCPLWVAVLELLLHLCSTGTLALTMPPMLVPLARFLRGMAARVRQPQATVYDSAMATVEVYHLLERLPNVPVASLDAAVMDGAAVMLGEAWSKDAAAEAWQQMLPPIPGAEEVAYQSPEPLPHQGDLKPELIQRKLKVKELTDKLDHLAKTATPISPELLRELLEQGVEIDIQGTMAQEQDDTSGLFVSDLENKGLTQRVAARPAPPQAERIREQLRQELNQLDSTEVVYRYDEWDYLLRDYRVQWCALREKPVDGADAGFVAGVLREDAALIDQVRKQFQFLKPEMFKKLKRRDHGEEIDIDAAIEGFVDRRITGVAPERVYIKRHKRDREVCTIFLLDLSASTDDPIEKPVPMAASGLRPRPPQATGPGFSGLAPDESFYAPPFTANAPKPQAKRIIDVEKEALIVMAEALESIGDEYAIYGFSGYGRDNVELFVVKEVEERYSQAVKRRIDGLKPYRSTRMGPPIRHAIQKLNRRPARLKTLLLLSDGYPQDFDYGKDRRGKEYGIQDTKVALQEARRKGIHTFCLTVDREGKSYLPEMCGAGKFIVIEHVGQLPRLLPNIYRGLTT